MKHRRAFSVAGIVAAAAAIGLAAAGYIQAGAKTAVKAKFDLTPETEIQLACINGSVSGGVNTVQKRYWSDAASTATKVREYNERAAEILSEDREFNEALGRVCHKLQSTAKKLAQTRQE